MSSKHPPLRVEGRFVNPHAKAIRRSFWDAILWKMGFYDQEAVPEPPADFVFPMPIQAVQEAEATAQFINHSTYLIKSMGLTFLTDPIWGRRCSPLSFIGPKREVETPIPLESISKVDVVLISHNHYDHLDKHTVQRLHDLHPAITWFVPLGVKKWFQSMGIESVVELSWWEDFLCKIGEEKGVTLKVTSTPAQHFSGRTLRDFNKTLWCGWVVEMGRQEMVKRFYFVGDTGYNPYDFKAVGRHWGAMDLTLIPIGCYSPRVFMSPIHTDPFDALMIHKEVGSKLSLGMHWGTFHLADEGVLTPPYHLFCEMKKQSIDVSTFLAPMPGDQIAW